MASPSLLLLPTLLLAFGALPGAAAPSLAQLKDAIESEGTVELETLLKEPDIAATINMSPEGTDFQFPGYSAVHYACLRGKTKHLKLLLAAGGDKDLATPSEVVPLHVAAANGYHKAVRVLLKAGAKTGPKSVSGMTAVTMAARSGNLDVLREFRAAGGKAMLALSKPDNNGFSAMKFAAEQGRDDLLRFMLFEVGIGSVNFDEIKNIVKAKAAEGKFEKELATVVEELSRPSKAYRAAYKGYFKQQEETNSPKAAKAEL